MTEQKTARKFLEDAESNQFKEFCEKAGIPATIRQVRKFRNRRGLAYKAQFSK